MTGMGSPHPGSHAVVAAFQRDLLHQGLVAAALVLAVFVAWNVLRGAELRRAAATGGGGLSAGPGELPEPPGRRLVRIAFGLLWVFDGILQGQASMPAGMARGVLTPAAAGSPGWVHDMVGWAAGVWQAHPASAAAAVVWIQIGVGLLALVAPRGAWSRLAGVAGAAWGAVVWVVAEAFGQLLAPGVSWLFGAPGAALFYVAAGALLALPETAWTPRLGRGVLRAGGAFWVAMAVLQAWPGRGFWRGGAAAGAPGTLAGMLREMSRVPQPRPLSSMTSAFAGFDAAHGWAVNLFAVAVLALVGCALLAASVASGAGGRWRDRREAGPGPARALAPAAVAAALVICAADWLLVQDLGFMGGLGTDPNSMVPMAVLLLAGYLALLRPGHAAAGAVAAPGSAGAASLRAWRDRAGAEPAYALHVVAGLAAVGITLLGVAPMALAAASL